VPTQSLRPLAFVLGERVRRMIGRIPPFVVILAALGGSWWLEQRHSAEQPRTVAHVVSARRAGRVAWMSAPGHQIGIGETVAKLDGEELGATIGSPIAGFVRIVLKKVGDVAVAGEPLVIVTEPPPPGQ
jgi:hypothetical protein